MEAIKTMQEQELQTLAEKIKAAYALDDGIETIINRIKEVIADDQKIKTYDLKNIECKAMKTLYKTEANKGDWLQDQTGLYEIINITPDGVEVKEVFFIDPDDYTSEDNYYLGNEVYTLSKWQVRHTYKATFDNSQQ